MPPEPAIIIQQEIRMDYNKEVASHIITHIESDRLKLERAARLI